MMYLNQMAKCLLVALLFSTNGHAQQKTYCNPINLDYGYTPIPNFSAKKRRGNWDENDIELIIQVVSSPNEEVEDILDAIEAKLAMQSEDVSYVEYKLEVAKWK